MCTEQTGCAILDEWSANRKVSRNGLGGDQLRSPRSRLPVTESLRPASMRSCSSPDVARATNAALASIHSGEVRHLWRHARMYRCRLARVVDHMADHTVIAQRHGDHVVEPYLRTLRRLDCPG